MSPASGLWDDLIPRVLSGAVLAGMGLGAVWIGEILFHVFIAVTCAAMIWELARMLGAENHLTSEYQHCAASTVSLAQSAACPTSNTR